MFISDIKVGANYSGFLQIDSVSPGETKTGSPYLFVKAKDITGEILVKIWSVEKEMEELLTSEGVGNFLKLENLPVGEYRGNLELTSQGGEGVNFIYRTMMEQDPAFNILDYTIGAPFTKDEMMQSVMETIRYDITDMDTRRLVATIFDKYREDFEVAPAAMYVHHNYEGGLLYHTYNMLNVAKSIIEFYPVVNKSLLLAGVVLHDLGKVIEYKNIREGGYEFSLEGELLGHISIMSSEIEQMGRDLEVDEEIILNLQHMVLSHHGKLEWGSPVLPKTPEAIMLHHIDNLDSKMEQIRSAVVGLKRGEKTDRIRTLGNVPIYLPDLNN